MKTRRMKSRPRRILEKGRIILKVEKRGERIKVKAEEMIMVGKTENMTLTEATVTKRGDLINTLGQPMKELDHTKKVSCNEPKFYECSFL